MFDWLDAAALFVLGWLGEKLKRLAKNVLDAIWFLISCTSTIRCFIAMHAYAPFVEQTAALRKSSQLKGAPLKVTARFINWANPKMQAWIERTGPGTPEWQKTMAQLKRNRARKNATTT